MKLGITDTEKKLLFIVLALGILVAAYFFGFQKFNEEAAIIEASNTQDESTVQRLQDMVNRQAETQQETEEYKKKIKEIIAKYPVDVPQEKAIYLIQQMEDIVLVDVSTISFSMGNVVKEFSGENAPSGKYANLAMNYTASYDQYKDLLQYVKDFADRTTTPMISAAYDQSTGQLIGVMHYRMFYLTNTDKEYEDVPPTDMEIGLPNIFHTTEEEIITDDMVAW